MRNWFRSLLAELFPLWIKDEVVQDSGSDRRRKVARGGPGGEEKR